MKLLCRTFPLSQAIVQNALTQHPGNDVVRDDILDALVAAVTALDSKALNSIPQPGQRDSQGLPMEIVYRGIDA